MKKYIITLLIILLFPAISLAKSGEASSQPEQTVKTQDKIQYRYNIQEVQRQTMEGNATVWTYDYVEVEPPITKAKIKAAIRGSQSDDTEIANVASELTAAQQKLRKLSQRSYSQIDNYIENNVTNLTSAKAVMKIMAKAIIAITKQLDLE